MPVASSQNVMATDDGAIPGESESTDGLIDQYRRYTTYVIHSGNLLTCYDARYQYISSGVLQQSNVAVSCETGIRHSFELGVGLNKKYLAFEIRLRFEKRGLV